MSSLWLNVLRNLVIRTNIWVALAAAGLVVETSFFLQKEVNWKLSLLVFFSTVFSYNFQRIVKAFRYRGRRTSSFGSWVYSNRLVLGILCLFCLGPIFLLLEGLGSFSILLLLSLSAIAMGYSVPIYKSKATFISLRDVPYLKIVWVVFTWVSVTVVLPVIEIGGFVFLQLPQFWMLLIERLFFLLAITLPFDMRDIYDDEQQKKTVPQILGVQRTQYLALASLAFGGTTMALAGSLGLFDLHLILTLGLVYLIAAYVLIRWKKQQGELYYTGILDGTMVLRALFAYATEGLIPIF